jgi:hypothetical protein
MMAGRRRSYSLRKWALGVDSPVMPGEVKGHRVYWEEHFPEAASDLSNRLKTHGISRAPEGGWMEPSRPFVFGYR